MDSLNIFDNEKAIKDQPAKEPSFWDRVTWKYNGSKTEVQIDEQTVLSIGF